MEQAKVYFTTFKATAHENLLQKLHRLRILILRINMLQLRFILESMEIWRSCARIMQRLWRIM